MDSGSAEWKYTSTSNNDPMEIHLGKVKTGQWRVSLIGLPIKTLRSADRGGHICDRRMMRPCSGRHLSLKCMTCRKLNDLWYLMKHVVILELYNSDQRYMCVCGKDTYVPETVGSTGHGNPEIQGSTVSAGPKPDQDPITMTNT